MVGFAPRGPNTLRLCLRISNWLFAAWFMLLLLNSISKSVQRGLFVFGLGFMQNVGSRSGGHLAIVFQQSPVQRTSRVGSRDSVPNLRSKAAPLAQQGDVQTSIWCAFTAEIYIFFFFKGNMRPFCSKRFGGRLIRFLLWGVEPVSRRTLIISGNWNTRHLTARVSLVRSSTEVLSLADVGIGTPHPHPAHPKDNNVPEVGTKSKGGDGFVLGGPFFFDSALRLRASSRVR